MTAIIPKRTPLWHPAPMFMSMKRHEREKEEIISASSRLTDVILQSSAPGLFVIDAQGAVQAQVSRSLAMLLRREEFSDVTIDTLAASILAPKTLAAARAYVGALLARGGDSDDTSPLLNVEVKLARPDGAFDTAHYSFEFTAFMAAEERRWLVRVTDISARVQQQRELEDLHAHTQLQSDLVHCLLTAGGARFRSFLQRTDASMKGIDAVLKKPAREPKAFRLKLDDILREVGSIRDDAASLRLNSLDGAARSFEAALQELDGREILSGSDFLPLAVRLDRLYEQFTLLRSSSSKQSRSAKPSEPIMTAPQPRMDLGRGLPSAPETKTQIIDMLPFTKESLQASTMQARRVTSPGTLDGTLATLTDLVAQEHHKTVTFQCTGLDMVPPAYQATVKNVAIQLIRNAVMHGIEAAEERAAAGKARHGSLALEFKRLPEGLYEILFQDDGRGLDPDKVRRIAVAKGIVSEEAASRLRDRQAIKLIFKSGFTTLSSAAGSVQHGTGMSLVRRYIHEAGGKIALASLLGHETRFKVTLPDPAASDSQVA